MMLNYRSLSPFHEQVELWLDDGLVLDAEEVAGLHLDRRRVAHQLPELLVNRCSKHSFWRGVGIAQR